MEDEHLTILSEYFYPESSSTSQLLTQLATSLTNHFDVSCITSFPNYHDADRDENVRKNEHHKNVEISRVRSTRFNKDQLPKRLVNWLTYTLATTFRLLRCSTDIVLVVSNPPILPVAAWLRKRIRGTPYVYLIHDLYPDIAIELGLISRDTLLEHAWRGINEQFLRDADRIIVLGESMRTEVLSRYDSVNESQVVVIHNWEDGSTIKPMPKSENKFAKKYDTDNQFTIVYSGNIGRFHELKTVIDAVSKLEAQGYSIKFLIIGEGARKSELKKYVIRRNISSVMFLPFQPSDRLPQTLTCGDVSLVGIKEGMQGLCVSSKLYSSLAAGQPILAVVGKGDEVEQVVEDCQCGVHVKPTDTDYCVKVIKRWMDNRCLLTEQGENARECFESRFSFAHARNRYIYTLKKAVN